MIFMSIIGLVLVAVSFSLAANSDPRVRKLRPVLMIGGILVIAIGVLAASVRQVDPGEVGVPVLFGQVQKSVLPSGLNVVNPLVEVETFNVKTQNYTMSSTHDEGDKSGDDAIRVLSADGLEVVIDLTVLYRIIPDESPKILSTIGTDYQVKIVRPVSRTRIRDNAVYYDAVSLYSKKRDEFQARIFKDIENDFRSRGILLEQLLIRNITLPESVKASIESKINAEQDAQKMQFVLQKEQQEAERKRVEAQGIADYQRIISTNLTDKQLQYEQIKVSQALATSPNSKVIVLSPGVKSPILINEGK